MQKIDIKSLSRKELEKKIEEMGQPPYRAAQIFRWLYASCARSFDGMTDLPAKLRSDLKSKFHMTRLAVADMKRSRIDGTAKYLFRLEDGNTIETVLLPERARNTICLSSQVGCKYACSFCASAPFGFVRNLTASEILEEVCELKIKNPSVSITHLVFMGIGEPLDNYDNVLKAIRIFNDRDAFHIGARRITISTCGLIPAMKRLEDEKLQIELSVSLHSAKDEVRSKLVPVNRRYSLKELIGACREYVDNTGRIITFEYILIKGVNASGDDALRLAKLLKGMKCKVNTIVYNQINPVRNPKVSNGVKVLGHVPPSEDDTAVFMKTLKANGVNAIQRKSKGADIDAGCGQLRISRL